MNDSIGLYLNDIGKVPLLTAEDERELSRVIEAGREAQEQLDAGKRSAAQGDVKHCPNPFSTLEKFTYSNYVESLWNVNRCCSGECPHLPLQ